MTARWQHTQHPARYYTNITRVLGDLHGTAWRSDLPARPREQPAYDQVAWLTVTGGPVV